VDAAGWDARYAEVDQVWSVGPNQFVEAELRALPPGRALDLACGEGRNAIWLAELGWRVTAIDFSSVGVERGRTRAAGLPVSWVVGDVLTVDLPEADLAVLAYLQLTAEQRRIVVRRAFAALEPGGTLFVVAHDSSNLTEGTGGPQDPSVLYTADDVLEDLARESFDVVRAGRTPRMVRVGDDHRGGSPNQDETAWDAVVRVTVSI
jgi:SAM-dependent methyltransferase